MKSAPCPSRTRRHYGHITYSQPDTSRSACTAPASDWHTAATMPDQPAAHPSIHLLHHQPIRYSSLFSACQLSVALLARLPAAAALLLKSHYTALCRLLINIDAPQAHISSRFTYVNKHYSTISSIQNQSVQRKRAKQENRHNLWDHHY